MPAALPTNRDLAKELWLQGFSPSQIEAQMGVKPATLRQWAARYGWKQAERESTSPVERQDFQEVALRLANLTVTQAERLLCHVRDSKLTGLRDSKDAAVTIASAYATARKALGLDDERSTIHLHVYAANKRQSVRVIDVSATAADTTAASTETVTETAPTADNAS